jgi:hypothetical protein
VSRDSQLRQHEHKCRAEFIPKLFETFKSRSRLYVLLGTAMCRHLEGEPVERPATRPAQPALKYTWAMILTFFRGDAFRMRVIDGANRNPLQDRATEQREVATVCTCICNAQPLLPEET